MHFLSIQDFLLANKFNYSHESNSFQRGATIILAEELIGKPLSYFEERYTLVPEGENQNTTEDSALSIFMKDLVNHGAVDLQTTIINFAPDKIYTFNFTQKPPKRRSEMSIGEKVEYVKKHGKENFLFNLPV